MKKDRLFQKCQKLYYSAKCQIRINTGYIWVFAKKTVFPTETTATGKETMYSQG
jgi:hypothetical protein